MWPVWRWQQVGETSNELRSDFMTISLTSNVVKSNEAHIIFHSLQALFILYPFWTRLQLVINFSRCTMCTTLFTWFDCFAEGEKAQPRHWKGQSNFLLRPREKKTHPGHFDGPRFCKKISSSRAARDREEKSVKVIIARCNQPGAGGKSNAILFEVSLSLQKSSAVFFFFLRLTRRVSSFENFHLLQHPHRFGIKKTRLEGAVIQKLANPNYSK